MRVLLRYFVHCCYCIVIYCVIVVCSLLILFSVDIVVMTVWWLFCSYCILFCIDIVIIVIVVEVIVGTVMMIFYSDDDLVCVGKVPGRLLHLDGCWSILLIPLHIIYLHPWFCHCIFLRSVFHGHCPSRLPLPWFFELEGADELRLFAILLLPVVLVQYAIRWSVPGTFLPFRNLLPAVCCGLACSLPLLLLLLLLLQFDDDDGCGIYPDWWWWWLLMMTFGGDAVRYCWWYTTALPVRSFVPACGWMLFLRLFLQLDSCTGSCCHALLNIRGMGMMPVPGRTGSITGCLHLLLFVGACHTGILLLLYSVDWCVGDCPRGLMTDCVY